MDCSIVIVSKGRASLTETIDSILKQTRKPKEVLINFDKERDGYTRLNELVAKTNTEAFFPLCDDDMIAPTFIEETLSLMEEKDANCVYTNLKGFGLESGEHTPGVHPFFTSLFKKKAFETVGGYDDNAGIYADALLGMKIWKLGNNFHIPKGLFLYRGSLDQMTKISKEESIKEYEKVKYKIAALN